MARPRIAPSSRKAHRIVFRLSQAELLPLAQKAAAMDLSVNEAARKLVLSRVERVVVDVGHTHDPALVKQLHHIGHNLNQLVKNAHIFGRVSPRVEQLCDRIDRLMDEVIRKEVD